MKQVWIWFILSCKRYLKRLPFLFLLILLPAGAFFIRQTEKTGDDSICIAVCALGTGENDLGKQLEQALISRKETDGMFRFYSCDTEEEVKDEVASRRAECGYVIEAGLEKKEAGKDWKNGIRAYRAPSTVADSIASETVFSVLTEIYDKEILENYIQSGRAFDFLGEKNSQARMEAGKEALERYEKWYDSENLFHFQYVYEDGGETVLDFKNSGRNGNQEKQGISRDKGESEEESILPVRGITAVLIFTAGLYGAVLLGEDERKGLFLPLSVKKRLPCQTASLAGAVMLTMISGFLALWSSGSLGSPVMEFALLMVYGVEVVFFSLLLKMLLRSPKIVACTIPFFIMGSLIFCPVFVDAGKWIEGAKIVEKLFLPSYYLRLF